MSAESLSIEPILSNEDREELRHLDYLSARAKDLLDRGRITADSFAAIDADRDERRDAIERRGRYNAALRLAVSLGNVRPADALAWAERARELDPSRAEAWAAGVELLWALHRDDEAVTRCAEAAGRFPELGRKHEELLARRSRRAEEAAARERALAEAYRASRQQPGADGETTGLEVPSATPERLDAPPPHWSWSSFAAEFLEEHWQKLILCLAVLLIVVSSTVGAHLLLGELLWRPAGKCALAMVWTILFAALGGGLIRWGAERAGRMMLVATLIVVPIHFMLAGEFKLVTEPTSAGLVVAAVDGFALLALVRIVAGMLVPRGQARFLSTALLLLSVGSIATARGSPVAWGWQFAAFQAPAVVFLGAVWCLGLRRWGESDEEHRDFAVLALGLLGFAFVACTIRIGAYALRLEPSLYAVPVMLGAIATVNAARRLVRYEPDVRRLAGIRYAGYVVSGLAFALAMATAPAASALSSGNVVAVGLLGFVLYAVALRRERHPAYLYLALAALVAARVGAHYFLGDRVRLVIDALRQFLGYEDRLPWAYLALLGLVINPALAALAVWFRRGWKDERLSRHAHYIGLPIAVLACLWSGPEPEAATIVLSGYAVLFAIAAWLFAEPRLANGTTLAVSGAAFFASTLVQGVSLADRSLIAIGLAWLFLGVGRSLRGAHAVPWIEASRALTMVGLLVATGFIAAWSPDSPSAAATFLLGGALAGLGAVRRPRVATAAIVLLSFVEFTICGLALLAGGRKLSPGNHALLLVGDGLFLLAIGRLLERMGPAADVFRATIPRFTIGLTFVADALALTGRGDLGIRGVVWLLGAPALLGVTVRVREVTLVYLGLAQLVAGAMTLSHWSMNQPTAGLATAWLAVTAAGLALFLWLAGHLGRRRGASDFYIRPCLNVGLGLTVVVLALAIGSRMLERDAYRLGVVALSVGAAATFLFAGTWRRFELTYAAILHLVIATYLVLLSTGRNDPRMAFVLGLAAVVLAIVFWFAGFACERIAAGRLCPYARPFYHATVALNFLGVLMADRSPVVVAMATMPFLLTVKSLPRVEWLYAAAACLVGVRWLSAVTPSGMMVSMVVFAFGFWMIGVQWQRIGSRLGERLGLVPLPYEWPIFHASIACGLLAATIRVSLTMGAGADWSAQAWLPLALAVLSFLMLRAFPRREWAHTGLAFLVYSIAAACFAWLHSTAAVALAGIATAMVLLLFEQATRNHAGAICERLGVDDAGYLGFFRAWSFGLFGIVAATVLLTVVGEMAVGAGFATSTARADWWFWLATMAMAAVYLVVAVSDPENGTFVEPAGTLGALHAIAVLLLWWLAAAGSPLSEWLPQRLDYFPLATAIASLSALYLARVFTEPGSWRELAFLGDVRSAEARRSLATQSVFLALLAIAMTGARISATTVVTMLLGSLAMAMAEFMGGGIMAAPLSGFAWVGACTVLGVVLARHLGFVVPDQQVTCAALGAMIAAFALWRWAGVLRRVSAHPKGFVIAEEAVDETLVTPFGVIAEVIASGAGMMASVLALVIGWNAREPASWVTLAGIGVPVAAAVLHILLAPRWQSERPVYAAQALLVAAYVRFRLAYPMATAADAAVLTSLAYLEMAIAEVLERLDRTGHYTRPTRFTSLVLPMLPLLEWLFSGRWDAVGQFYLAASAAFYATACGRLRWKTLGYAAAVFADAALWLTWSRMGWQLADYPQLYLVPVGISAILFAEVNRELGRDAVNAIRTVGLIVIYASLALPIWQFASFGAWVMLLLVSLLGVFLGIGLRLQTFLWLGLVTFVLDVVYELGRVSLDFAIAKWAIMLGLGIALVLFVALNEKKRILSQMLDYYAHARTWE